MERKKGDTSETIYELDTFHNTQTTFLSETADLTLNIERSLSDFEKIGKYVSNLKPIGDAWEILTPIGLGISGLIAFLYKKRKDKQGSLAEANVDKKKVKKENNSFEEKRSPI